jgi:hypothetical protein
MLVADSNVSAFMVQFVLDAEGLESLGETGKCGCIVGAFFVSVSGEFFYFLKCTLYRPLW